MNSWHLIGRRARGAILHPLPSEPYEQTLRMSSMWDKGGAVYWKDKEKKAARMKKAVAVGLCVLLAAAYLSFQLYASSVVQDGECFFILWPRGRGRQKEDDPRVASV